jgi:hypothetical protein
MRSQVGKIRVWHRKEIKGWKDRRRQAAGGSSGGVSLSAKWPEKHFHVSETFCVGSEPNFQSCADRRSSRDSIVKVREEEIFSGIRKR